MRILLYCLAAVGLLAGAARAEPVKLSDAQMDQVAAGLLNDFSVLSNFNVANNLQAGNGTTTHVNNAIVVPVALSNNTTTAIGLGLFSGSGQANAFSNSLAGNLVGVGQR
jgi:hypothetical protein